jgi:glycosyltransferase involved in cell wall biosynthesis
MSVLVVNDGSTDQTSQVAAQTGALVVSHRLNRGKGAATKTGLEAAKILDADIVVTMDADGQHHPDDIAALINPIRLGACDVTLGTRPKNPASMPVTRILSNHIANFVTWTFFGLYVQDSQSGFRAYSNKALRVISTSADAYDYESEVIREIRRHHLIYKEVPIGVHYTDYSMSKPTRQDFANGFKTLYKIIWKVISF